MLLNYKFLEVYKNMIDAFLSHDFFYFQKFPY